MKEKYSGGFWLTRFCMSIMGAVHFGDEIEVATWPTNDSRGFSFNRCFEVKVGENTVCEGYSVWALMDVKEMRPVPVKDLGIDLSPIDPIKPSAPIHVRIPRDMVMTDSGDLTVCYRDVDYNGHMNNARYPDVICGFLPYEELEGKRISEISISFMHEAHLGEKISGGYAYSEEDGVYYVRTRRMSDGEVNIESRVILTDC